MSATLNTKQRKIVKAKIKGKTDKEIGQEVYPNQTPDSARVSVTRQLNKPNVSQYLEQSKMIALKEHNITWSRIIKPISDALEAGTQVRDKEGEVIDVIPDLNTRLRASRQAQELLRVKEEVEPEAAKLLANLPEGINEVELQRLLFKKT